MISIFYESLRGFFGNREEALKRQEFEENQKLQEIIKFFKEEDDENENERARQDQLRLKQLVKPEDGKKRDCSKIEGKRAKNAMENKRSMFHFRLHHIAQQRRRNDQSKAQIFEVCGEERLEEAGDRQQSFISIVRGLRANHRTARI